MTAGAAEFPPELVQMLVEVGYLAAGSGRAAQALAIMDGVKAMRPDRAAPYVGTALAHLNAGRPAEAVRVLREEGLAAVAANEADSVRVFLALALQIDGRPRECLEMLDRIPPDCGEEGMLRLARSLRESCR